MGGRTNTQKVLDSSRSNNGSRTSMLVLPMLLSVIYLLLWNYIRFKTWSPRRVINWSENYNDLKSSFWVKVRSHWPFQGGCWWSWKVVARTLTFPVGVDSDGRFSGDLLVIVSGAIKKHPHWTIFDFPPENSMVYKSPNCPCGGMFTFLQGLVIHSLNSLRKYSQ